MPDEITFFDLVSLLKIKPGTTVERYGGLINSSFFDGANVLGTLSQKKLVSLSTAMPDQNPISVTDVGKQLIAEADERAKAEFDHLDLAILTQVSNGKSEPSEIGKAVNVRSKDLAMHLYKLSKSDYTTYEFVSGSVNVMLTEKGFAQVKAGMPQKPPQPQPPQVQPQQKGAMAQQPQRKSAVMQPPELLEQKAVDGMTIPTNPAPTTPIGEVPPEMAEIPKAGHKKRNIIIALVVIIIVIMWVVYYLHFVKHTF